jgi:hypothetical protein
MSKMEYYAICETVRLLLYSGTAGRTSDYSNEYINELLVLELSSVSVTTSTGLI